MSPQPWREIDAHAQAAQRTAIVTRTAGIGRIASNISAGTPYRSVPAQLEPVQLLQLVTDSRFNLCRSSTPRFAGVSSLQLFFIYLFILFSTDSDKE